MIQEFRSLIAESNPRIYLFSNSQRLLVLLTRMFRRAQSGAVVHNFNCQSDSPSQLEEFLQMMRSASLLSKKKAAVISDLHCLSEKHLSKVLSYMSAAKNNSILLTSVGEVPKLSAEAKVAGIQVFNSTIMNAADLNKLIKELSKAFNLPGLRRLPAGNVDELLNTIALLRLSGYSELGGVGTRTELDLKLVINEYLQKQGSTRFIKSLYKCDGQMLELAYGIMYRLLSILYLKMEGRDKNYKLVPYWVRNQVAAFIKGWDRGEALNALRKALKLEIALKSSGLNPKESAFLHLVN